MCLCVHVVCADLCMSSVRCLVCVARGILCVSRVGISKCCVQFATTNLVASLRAHLASLATRGPDMRNKSNVEDSCMYQMLLYPCIY